MRFRKILCCMLIGLTLSNHVLAKDLEQVAPDKVGLSSERLSRLDSVINSYIKDKQIAGAVVMVARQDKVAYFKSFGQKDIEANEPMKNDTIFRLASMTKPITTTAVMMLYEEGKFGLDDPISKYIPEFKEPKVLVNSEDGSYKLIAAKREISIRDLLSHTSGISYRFWGRKNLETYYKNANISDGLSPTEGTIGDEVKRLAKLPLLNQPGEAFEYGLNTDVLGYFVEVISGMPLDHFFKTRIFNPLDMKDTAFYLPKEKISRLAALYVKDDKLGIKRADENTTHWGELSFAPNVPYAATQSYFSGGAGLTSTTSDYMRFLQMLLNGGQLDGKRILSRKSIELMTSNQIGNAKTADSLPAGLGKFGTKFGLGFGIQTGVNQLGLGSEGEYTWAGIFFTRFYIDPKEKMITLMMTQRMLGNAEIEEKIHTLGNAAIID
ncbi:MAG: serine hydrolase domain-containing protein [Methylophilus sp.]|nr:serine hydrolase domain-containing protein [Methylophilus sp.]